MSKVNFCEFCDHHKVYIDELEGNYYHDGCICDVDIPDSEHFHKNNCTEHVNSELRSECPYFKLAVDGQVIIKS